MYIILYINSYELSYGDHSRRAFTHKGHLIERSMFLLRYIVFNLDRFKAIKQSSPSLPFTAGDYNYPLTWNSAQSNIYAFSTCLIGYSMQFVNSHVRLKGSLASVTSSGATFIFSALSSSNIMYADFSYILAKTCQDKIEIYYKCKNNLKKPIPQLLISQQP